MPEEALQRDALNALEGKRGNTHGAGMFWTLPCARSPCLLRLLITYQILWDYLDSITEHAAGAGEENAQQLHLALIDALDPGRPTSDYYHYHPWCEDGGYLRALVQACRQLCLELPSFQMVRSLLVRDAARVNVQAINHNRDPASREAALREWVAREFPAGHEVQWFELAAASGANIAIYALFALAAEPACEEEEITRVYRAYFPWAAALATMLDSFVDEEEDTTNGEHRYIAYYPTPELATQRIARLFRLYLYEIHELRNSERHTLLAACMAAMYLSKDSARTTEMRRRTQCLVDTGGSLTKYLLPVLRGWRTSFDQRSA
jgi:tetraprenyl-beta-curcumene synthase